MDLRNPHTGETVLASEPEQRGSPTIGPAPLETAGAAPTLPQDAPDVIATKRAESEAQARCDANAWAALGVGPDVLARCEAEGVTLKFVRKLMSERTFAKAALDGIDHVLAMLGIEAI